MRISSQLIKFILVGALNTLFGYSCYASFIFIGLSYYIALFLATCVGIIFNFKTIGKFVFAKSDNSHFLKFIGVCILIYLVNVALIKINGLFTDNLYLAGLMAIIPVAIISFICNKYIVFKDRYEIS